MIKEIVRLDLKENQEYSLRLRVKSQSQTVTSQKHIFSKLSSSLILLSTHDVETYLYKQGHDFFFLNCVH